MVDAFDLGLRRMLLGCAFGLILTQNAQAEETVNGSQNLSEEAIASDYVVKSSLEVLLSCASTEMEEIKRICFEFVADTIEAWARLQDWDVEALKVPFSPEVIDGANEPVADDTANTSPLSVSQWIVDSKISEIDDSTNVYLALSSSDDIRKRYGKAVRCGCIFSAARTPRYCI